MSNREARKINQFFANFIAKLRKWLNQIGSPFRISRRFVRSLFSQSRRPGSSQAGFVLPTVVLVTTVVTLLTVTLVTRSADRARTAVNARVEQASRVAATPLIDRARVKIQQLINDDTLPKGIPSDTELFNVISDRNNTTALYTFGDETRLQLFDTADNAIPGDTIPTQIAEAGPALGRRTSRTAWRVGLDTDGNTKLDTFGLYSIIFRKPRLNGDASVLSAKAAPMAEGSLGANCVAADLAGSVAGGAADWYAQPGRLSKSFFVHAVTIPITDEALTAGQTNGTIPNDGSYEAYTGSPSFAALELQQDRFFKSQNPNAVWFDGDVEIYSRSSLKINGRIVAGGNLLVAPDTSIPKQFYQVSDPYSCFYEEDNSKIIVAGNVVDGDTFATGAASTATNAVIVDLFRGKEVAPNLALTSPTAIAAGPNYINADNRTVEESGASMVLNENAFERRFNAVLKAALEIDTADTSTDKTTRPREVFDATEGGISIKDAYSAYIRQRLRKVPFKEVPFGLSGGVDADVYAPFTTTNLTELTTKTKLPDETGYNPLTDNYTATLRDELFSAVNSGGSRQERQLKLEWSLPLVPAASVLQPYNDDFQNPGGFVAGDAAKAVNLKALAINKGFLPATSDEERKAKGVEQFIGDRILVGNNLPNRWLKKLDASGTTFEYASDRNKFFWAGGASINTVLWDDPATEPRYRITQATPFPDLGNIARDASWEYQAAQDPGLAPYPKNSGTPNSTFTPVTGGLRVVTGSGIYSREGTRTFLPAPQVEQGRTPATFYNNNDRSLIVWSDAMPMTGAVAWNTGASAYRGYDPTARTWTEPNNEYISGGVAKKGDLQMRAIAVYHYKDNSYDEATPTSPTAPATYQTPIACVSSYYNPTNAETARNLPGLPDVSGLFDSDDDGAYDQTADGRSFTPVPNSVANPANRATGTQGLSNNGVSYNVGTITAKDITKTDLDAAKANLELATPVIPPTVEATTTATNLANRLYHHSQMIFPNGRYANEPLKKAVDAIRANRNLTLAEQAAIDAEICALRILDGSATVDNSRVPHGAFKEATFLDGRQVKALNNNELTQETTDASGNPVRAYDLEIEQRQPLEIRTTDINLNLLRSTPITGSVNNVAGLAEYLLPYSGIIYATRDDALPDNTNEIQTSAPIPTGSTGSLTLSATDFKLDPTRRPNGIRLINGQRLWRRPNMATASQPNYTDASRGEKGLTLVSNNPVYIKGDFNLHKRGADRVEEFNNLLDPDYSNIYTRANTAATTRGLNFNFACRPNQRISPVTNTGCLGDEWRKADIIADAVTVQSTGSKDGFRDQGDFDLRNNQSTGRTGTNGLNIIGAPAKFATANFNETTFGYLTRGFLNNSYVTNFNYVLNNGGAGNFFPGTNRNTYNANGVTPVQRRALFGEYSMEICRKLPISECGDEDWIKAGAGTTVLPDGTTPVNAPRYIAPNDLRFPRRVAFLRLNEMPAGYTPVEIPIDRFSSGRTAEYATSDTVAAQDIAYVSSFLANTSQAPLAGTVLPSLTIPIPTGGFVSGRTTPYTSGDTVNGPDIPYVNSFLATPGFNQDSLLPGNVVPPLKIKILSPTPSGRTVNYKVGAIVDGVAATAGPLSGQSDRDRLPTGMLSTGSGRGGRLILSGMLRCANSDGMPVPIGVINGNLATGSTYGYTPVAATTCVNFASASSLSIAGSLASSASNSASTATSTSGSASASTSNSTVIGVSLSTNSASASLSNSLSTSTRTSASNSSASPSVASRSASTSTSASRVTSASGSASVVSASTSRVVSASNSSASPSVASVSRSASGSLSVTRSFSRSFSGSIIVSRTVSATVSRSASASVVSASAPSASASTSTSTSISIPRSASTASTSVSSSIPTSVSRSTSVSTSIPVSRSASTSRSTSIPISASVSTSVSIPRSASTVSASVSTSIPISASASASLISATASASNVSRSIVSATASRSAFNSSVSVSRAGGRTGLIQPTIALGNNQLPVGAIMPAIRKGVNAPARAVMPTNTNLAAAFPYPEVTNVNTRGFAIESDFDASTNGAGKSTSYVNPTTVFDTTAPGARADTNFNNALWFRTTNAPGEDLSLAFAPSAISYGFGTGGGSPIFMLIDQSQLGDADYQPLVLPVMQLNFPNANPEDGPDVTNRGTDDYLNSGGTNSGKWTEAAANTTVNAIIVAGATPSRTFSRYDLTAGTANLTSEGGGDLPNFVRLIENWDSRTLTITGGFFQNRKSQFATAPFVPTYPFRDPVAAQVYPGQWNETEITSIFREYIGTTDRTIDSGNKQSYISRTGFGIPYYYPSERIFGYDVGILSVSPNLFDSLFVEPSPVANEYFREVDRQDEYVKNLLCAVQNPDNRLGGADPTAINTPDNYTRFTLADPKMRPGSCQSTNPGYI